MNVGRGTSARSADGGARLDVGRKDKTSNIQRPTSNKLIVLIAILGLTIAAYLPSLDNGFTNWDDPVFILENPLVQARPFSNLGAILTTPIGGCFYPVTVLSFQIEHALYGFEPFPYHFHNLLLHLLNVLLVFLLLQRLRINFVVAAWATLLFAIHPLQVEAVAWVASRKDVLFAFFYLLVVWVYAGPPSVERTAFQQRLRLTFMFVLFVLALKSKPMAISLPAVLLMIDHYRQGKLTRENFLEKIPWFAVAGFFIWLTMRVADQSHSFPATGNFTMPERVALSAQALTLYVAKLILPVLLSCLYPFEGNLGRVSSGLALLFLGMLLTWAVYGDRLKGGLVATRWPLIFFMVTLAPVLHLLRVNTSLIYERFVYLPSLGIFLVFGMGLAGSWQRLALRPVLVRGLGRAIIIGYIMFLSVSTFQRCRVWHDSVALWSDVVRKFPDDPTAYIHRGDAYHQRGEDALAMRDLNRAVRRDPDSALAYFDRGGLLAVYGQWSRALADYRTALGLPANDPALRGNILHNKGLVLAFQGNFDEAIAQYRAALQLDPDNIDANLNLAIALLKKEEYADSLIYAQKALSLAPENQVARQLVHFIEGKL